MTLGDACPQWTFIDVKMPLNHIVLLIKVQGFYVKFVINSPVFSHHGVVEFGEGVMHITSPGLTDIGLQLGKACCPCSR